jgi:apolipoprotein N-acyltransferase
MAIACLADMAWDKSKVKGLLVVLTATAAFCASGGASRVKTPARELRVTGIQLEFPTEKEVLVWLTKTAQVYPNTDLFVLSEYTLEGAVPESLKNWCREHHHYLVVGGKEQAGNDFYNTAFVISPDGKIVFRQVKSVPIQFFKDGLPAPEQKVWDSPWCKLGICICYDLSYRRVTDRLVELGAEALIVPTMDVIDWGRHQHELHARIGPVRAAEYELPIFRLASSGISQAIDRSGQILGSAPCPGEAAVLTATLPLQPHGRTPLDRWFAPLCTVTTCGLLLLMAITWRPTMKRESPC